MSVDDCRIIELPRITDPRGNLTFIEGGHHLPFQIARVYYLYDVPRRRESRRPRPPRARAVHLAMSGSFDVVLDDGREQRTFSLNRSYYGLYMPRMVWRELVNFSSGSVCTVLASRPYEEEDYFRDYDEFVAAMRS
jgi:hypothetical protein